MRALARIRAEADGPGPTRLTVLRGEPPLLLRRTGPQRTGPQRTDPQHTGPQGTGPQHTGPQHTGPQGTGPQGTGPQHTGPQGTGPQHTGPQGTGPQHTGPQGTGPQHTGPQGTGPQHTGPQGTGPQHTGPQGTGPQHTGPQGTGPQHTGPQGTGPQHTGPQGTGPQHTGPQGTGPQHTGPQGTGPPLDTAPAAGGWSAGGGVTVHLVGGAAGPLRGDDLRLEIEVGPGARLDVRSVAASIALPGRPGDPPSRLIVHATVAAGATLRWLPEPLIAAAGCHHITVADVHVAAGGSLVWRDDLVCGRHGEPSGDVTIKTLIRYADRTLYRNDLAVGPSAPGWSGAAVLGDGRRSTATHGDGRTATAIPGDGRTGTAVLGDGRATGSVVLAGPELPPARILGPEAALMALAGPGMLATAVGADIRAIRAALDPLCEPSAARPSPNADPAPAAA